MRKLEIDQLLEEGKTKYQEGVRINMSALDEVITLSEAAEKWGLDTSTFRKAILRGEFAQDEYRKTDKTILLLASAAERFAKSRNPRTKKK